MEHLAGHGAAPPRRPDHRDRLRREEQLERIRGGTFLARIESRQGLGRQRRGKRQPQLAWLRVHSDREPRFAHELQHPMVAGKDFGVEDSDAVGISGLGKVREEESSQTLAVIRIGDRDGNFRVSGARWHIHGVSDDAGCPSGNRHEAERAAVHRREPPGGVREEPLTAPAKEPEPSRVVGKAAKERAEGVLVARAHGPDMKRRAITQHDIGFAMEKVRLCSHATWSKDSVPRETVLTR